MNQCNKLAEEKCKMRISFEMESLEPRMLAKWAAGWKSAEIREPSIPVHDLSLQQRIIIDQVKEHLKKSEKNQLAEPLRILVQGKPGSGKTLLGHHIRYILEQRKKINSGFKFAIIAYTGSAASILSGTTIHSAFGIPLYLQAEDQEEFIKSFNVTSVRAIKLRMTKFFLIDEVSFLGQRMLNLIDQILRRVSFVDKDKPFANKSVIMMGDLWQLGPIGDYELYTTPAVDSPQLNSGFNLYRAFDRVFALKNSYRQGGNDEVDVKYRRFLHRLKSGTCENEDIELMLSRRKNQLSPSELEEFKHCLHIFPRNTQVNSHNLSMLKSTYRPEEIVVVENGDEILQIAIGAPVVLLKNLHLEWRLVNSARGVVKNVIYKDDLVYCIIIDFPDYSGNMIEMQKYGGIPIFRQYTNTYCRYSSRFIWVNKFPISLSYAMTIHKVQGLTLDSIAVYLDKSEMFPGMDYISLSRTRRINNLIILDEDIAYDRFSKKSLREKVLEENRLMNLERYSQSVPSIGNISKYLVQRQIK